MNPNLQKILESKRNFRRKLADLPVEEKLRMLDALRERELAIRGHSGDLKSRGSNHASNSQTKP